MTFYSRYRPAKGRGMSTGPDTLVSAVPVLSTSAKIGQMMLTGMRIDAINYGYDYQADEKLPDEIVVRPGRAADVTELMSYITSFGERMREAMATAKQVADAANDPPAPERAPTPAVSESAAGSAPGGSPAAPALT